MTEAILEVLQLGEATTDEIVSGAAGAAVRLGEFRVRPVLIEMETARLALPLGEQGAVDVEQPLPVPQLHGWIG